MLAKKANVNGERREMVNISYDLQTACTNGALADLLHQWSLVNSAQEMWSTTTLKEPTQDRTNLK